MAKVKTSFTQVFINTLVGYLYHPQWTATLQPPFWLLYWPLCVRSHTPSGSEVAIGQRERWAPLHQWHPPLVGCPAGKNVFSIHWLCVLTYICYNPIHMCWSYILFNSLTFVFLLFLCTVNVLLFGDIVSLSSFMLLIWRQFWAPVVIVYILETGGGGSRALVGISFSIRVIQERKKAIGKA